MKNIYELSQKSRGANEYLGSSVKMINKDAVTLAQECGYERSYFVGVKDSSSIDRGILKKLCMEGEFIWHTLDTTSDRGRAVDISMLNPINGRLMTGSSSGTAVNVLYGINDIGIGTDGGGSVIYPAMALNLYSFMGKGVGLAGEDEKVSTDGIRFNPGLGIISHDLSLIRKALEKLGVEGSKGRKVKISLGSMDGIESSDLRERVDSILVDEDVKRMEVEINDEREELISSLGDIFLRTDILIIYERDVDAHEYGDSVMGGLGREARMKQARSNKRVGKAANMMNLTAITIPDRRSASGIIILAREGKGYGMAALDIAERLMGDYMPELYYDYFKRSYLKKKNELVFKL